MPPDPRRSGPYTLVGPDGQTHPSPTPGTLGGHRRTRIYGRLDCRTALRALAHGGYFAHRVFFADENTAIAAGYRPCGVCLAEHHHTWKLLRDARPGHAPDAAALRAAYSASRRLQDRFGPLDQLGPTVIGHSRDHTAREAARLLNDLLLSREVEVRDVVDWPPSAASFLRHASRFTASAPELWVVLISEHHGWMWMRQRLRHTSWNPDHTLVIATAPDISDLTHS